MSTNHVDGEGDGQEFNLVLSNGEFRNGNPVRVLKLSLRQHIASRQIIAIYRPVYARLAV